MNNFKFTLKAIIALTVFVFTANAQQWDGLTYYSNSGSTSGYLIDTNSTNVKVWSFTGQGGTGYSTHLMPGGVLWRSVSNSAGNVLTGGGMTGRIQKWDYAGNKLWDYTYSSSTYCLHHDHCPLPNGNVLVISYDVRTATDAYNAGATNSITVWSEKIMELQPVGTNSAVVVWEWKVWDHLVQNLYPTRANYATSIVNNPGKFNINYSLQKDWLHMNGIDYNPMLDQIVISSHNLNEWYVIDHSTTTAQAATGSGGNSGMGGDILYRWGNPLAYQATGTKILDVTHDAHWIKEGIPNAGYLVGLNNKGSTGPKTTVDQISVPRSNYNYTLALGSAYTPSTFNLRHTSTGYTSNMGSSNQFPNGNQMVCLAMSGTIYEIDPAGNVLWTKTTGGACPQSHRYTQCYISNPAPAQPSISVSGNDLVSTTGVTYQWYVDGNLIPGATSQNYTPTQNGIYVVRVTDSNGCVYAYSAGYPYTLVTGIKENQIAANLKVYPNPSSGIVTIDDWYIKSIGYSVNVIDAQGKVILSTQNENKLDLSSFDSGVYFISIQTADGMLINKRVSLVK
ncbi:MAG: aryl-sulfate sulfotransferase [Bacteroidia bacterium]|nr:aryl-sulfate sulfotransferase [Bacteroidia bacterium]